MLCRNMLLGILSTVTCLLRYQNFISQAGVIKKESQEALSETDWEKQVCL